MKTVQRNGESIKVKDVYKECPILENDRFLIRLITREDAADLFKVYGDKMALPFFNSDNCHGTNFYCATREMVAESIYYWLKEYAEGGFVRFTIVDKAERAAVGTIELFNRRAEDYFDDCGLLRLDLRTDYENSRDIASILSIITEPAFDLFHCSMIATKAPIYAVDRREALEAAGYELSEECLIGSQDHKAYDGYWVKKRSAE